MDVTLLMQAMEDHCMLPALLASICLLQHPSLQGSEAGARALWDSQVPRTCTASPLARRGHLGISLGALGVPSLWCLAQSA